MNRKDRRDEMNKISTTHCEMFMAGALYTGVVILAGASIDPGFEWA